MIKNQKITKRAESPIINSVGHRPTRKYVDRIGRRPVLMMLGFQPIRSTQFVIQKNQKMK